MTKIGSSAKYDNEYYELKIILTDESAAYTPYTLEIEVIGKCYNSTNDEC